MRSISNSPNRFMLGLPICAAIAATLLFALSNPPGKTVLAADRSASTEPVVWDRAAAERYLDSREAWWQDWDRTHKDHGTYCISCHTQAPYGLARPILRQDLHEPAPSGAERVMLDSIEKRVRMWKDVEPFYLDAQYGKGKEIESRNAEAVLNAIILASYDAHLGRITETTRLAFDNAWALQSKDGPAAGAWVWQNFHYPPWESPESEYHGAALFAVAVGEAPAFAKNEKLSLFLNGKADKYRDDPKIAGNLAALRGYLQNHYDAQPLLNKTVALWASAHLPDLLTHAQREKLFAELLNRQRTDGGWSLKDLGTWERVDNTPLPDSSDGYATGLVVLVLQENAVTDPRVKRGLDWLADNQDKTTGAWAAWSLNKNRDPQSNIGQFMSDAATSYAVLALDARKASAPESSSIPDSRRTPVTR
ncbi:MAG: hypothetical protein ABSF28_07170 [Terracidiphilus sp.]